MFTFQYKTLLMWDRFSLFAIKVTTLLIFYIIYIKKCWQKTVQSKYLNKVHKKIIFLKGQVKIKNHKTPLKEQIVSTGGPKKFFFNVKPYIRTQSESYMMTVSAPVRLIPTPPALVERRKMKIEGSLLNSSIWKGQYQLHLILT